MGVRDAFDEELIIGVRGRPRLGYERISLDSDTRFLYGEETPKGTYLVYENVLPCTLVTPFC